jgi:type IV secretion system protein VirB9
MNRRLLWRCALLLVSLATLAGARAESVPARGAVDARIREVTYNAEEVYRLTGYVGYQLEFEFSEGERFVGLAAGDVKALSFESEGNHLFLKPTAPGVLTNLTILTTRHHYRVDYAVATGRPDLSRADVIYAVRFQYPEDLAHADQARADASRIAADLRTPAAVVNWDYWYCGPPTLRPVAAYDDGFQTHLRFSDASELPALFIRNEDGSESLTNFTVTAQEVVVHRVAHQMILRRGQLVACLVNKGFGGAQQHAPGGTISPQVLRATRSPAEIETLGAEHD